MSRRLAMLMPRQDRPMYGAMIALRQWVSHIVRDGTLEGYDIYASPSDLEAMSQWLPQDPRVRMIPSRQIPSGLAGTPYRVLLGFDSAAKLLRVIRDQCAAGPCPISVMVNSLSYQDIYESLMHVMLLHQHPFDTFVCPTEAARVVVGRMIEQARQSPPLRRTTLGWENLHVVPHGVDVERFRARPDRTACRREVGLPLDAAVILSVGRLSSRDKINYFVLIDAFASLVKRWSSPAAPLLVLAGSDRYQEARHLLEYVSAAGLSSRVRIIPNFPESMLVPLYGSADLFVSPANSVQESFGLTILEAAAAELPIVATDWDGYKNLITHGVNGLLAGTRVTPASSSDVLLPAMLSFIDMHEILAGRVIIDPSELAGLMHGPLHDSAQARRLAAGAGELADRHAWPRVVKRIEDHWDAMWESAQGQVVSRGSSRWFVLDYDRVFAHYPTDGGLPVEGAAEWAPAAVEDAATETPALGV